MIGDGKLRPSDDMVDRAFDANDAGAGIAWREGGYVKWEKGIQEVERVQQLCRELPTPYVVHFRIPTEGGRRPGLCHPFPVEKNVPLDLTGRTKGFVLFHNGHWTDWRKMILETVIGRTDKIPIGKWSDTRAMAFVASFYGLGVLEMINEKAVAFGPNDIEVFPGTGWSQDEGIWCSNLYWKNRTHYKTNESFNQYNQTRRMCRHSTCTRTDLDGEGYCALHTAKKPEIDVTKSDACCKFGVCRRVDSLDKEGRCPSHTKELMGGNSDTIPFARAIQLFAENKITKKQYKKARRAYDKLLKAGKIKPYQLPLKSVPAATTEEVLH